MGHFQCPLMAVVGHRTGRLEYCGDAVIDETAALHISEFFWTMVDSSINCTKEKKYPWPDGAEFWNEKILTSLSGSLERLGFIQIWDDVVDKQ